MGRELRRRNLKNGAFTLKTLQMLSIFSTPEEFKNGTITAILYLCLSKIRTENHLSFQNVFGPRKNQNTALCFSNSSDLKKISVLFTVLTEGLTRERKLCFQISPAWLLPKLSRTNYQQKAYLT